MRSIEAEGNTIDDAIANALKALEVERDRVEIEILSDATRGLFGLRGRKAKVRATVRTPVWTGAERGAQEAAPRRERDHGDAQGRQPSERPERVARPRRRSPEPPPARGDSREADEEARDGELEASEFADPGPAPGFPITQEALEHGAELLSQILELMGIPAKITEERGATPDDAVLQVDGEASGVVIGRHGQGLDAIEYILNRMVARRFNDSGHIVVDAASYRARRRESLTEMARRMAEKAKRERRTVTLNPLSPRDRRIVHIALKDDREVTTRSHGAGLHRKLLIVPQGGRRHGGGIRSR